MALENKRYSKLCWILFGFLAAVITIQFALAVFTLIEDVNFFKTGTYISNGVIDIIFFFVSILEIIDLGFVIKTLKNNNASMHALKELTGAFVFFFANMYLHEFCYEIAYMIEKNIPFKDSYFILIRKVIGIILIMLIFVTYFIKIRNKNITFIFIIYPTALLTYMSILDIFFESLFLTECDIGLLIFGIIYSLIIVALTIVHLFLYINLFLNYRKQLKE